MDQKFSRRLLRTSSLDQFGWLLLRESRVGRVTCLRFHAGSLASARQSPSRAVPHLKRQTFTGLRHHDTSPGWPPEFSGVQCAMKWGQKRVRFQHLLAELVGKWSQTSCISKVAPHKSSSAGESRWIVLETCFMAHLGPKFCRRNLRFMSI